MIIVIESDSQQFTAMHFFYQKSKIKNQAGFTLLEVIVTMAIIGFAFVTLIETYFASSIAATNANNVRIARLLAERKLGEIMARGYFSADHIPEAGSGDWREDDDVMHYPRGEDYRYEIEYAHHLIAPDMLPEDVEALDPEAEQSRIAEVKITVYYPKLDDEGEETNSAGKINEGKIELRTFLVQYSKDDELKE
ncbi:MAG: type II secretion system GspH family protein [Planctomycetes bacterium]|nr:type II secretion system GspH family protein [Planctomycetota bacterium]